MTRISICNKPNPLLGVEYNGQVRRDGSVLPSSLSHSLSPSLLSPHFISLNVDALRLCLTPTRQFSQQRTALLVVVKAFLRDDTSSKSFKPPVAASQKYSY